MEDKWRGKGFTTSLIAVVVIALIAVGLKVAWNFASDSTAPTSTVSQEIIDALTVKTASADAECSLDANGLVSYQVDALTEVPDPRKWSDALSTPFTATTANEIRNELQQAICKDPLLGVSYLVFFATDVRDQLLVDAGVDILKLNPWLKPFAVDPSEINAKAAEFIPLLDVKNPSDKQVNQAINKNREWQQLASYVNTLLDRFEVSGIEARKSIVNYHLAVGGLVVGSLPSVERNPNQESLPALILSLTEKDQCQAILEMGANVADKRPELFKVSGCEPQLAECTTDCGSTTPVCTENCTPICPPNQPNGGWDSELGKLVCKDSPDRDTEAQDNNKPGGGGIAPVQTDPVGNPEGGTPADIYTPPAPAPVPTPDPAPAPAPEATQPPASGCAPAPGETTCP